MDKNWHLDKDIRIKGNKIYSPDTCLFVPARINTLFLSCTRARGKYPIGISMNRGKFVAKICKGDNKVSKSFREVGEAFQFYKLHKEAYIKEVADEWQPLIEEEAYIAMYNWKIEITD